MRVLSAIKNRKITFAVLFLFLGAATYMAAQPTAFQNAFSVTATSFLSSLFNPQPAQRVASAAMPLAMAPSASITLEQCHNLDDDEAPAVPPDLFNDCDDPFSGGQTHWGSGNAQFSNARLREGDNQNYRAIIDNLPNGTHILDIELDLTKGGQMAYDRYSSPGRLRTETDPDGATKAGPGITPESLGIFPCENNNDADAYCTPETGTAVQIPTYGNSLIPESAANPGFKADLYNSQANDIPEYFFIYGTGATLSIQQSGYSFTGSVDGDSSVRLSMTITKSGGTGRVVLAWGAHVSKEFDYENSGKSTASDIEGSPYHMRLKSFSALQGDPGNQDMQMASSAIVAAPVINVTKSADITEVCAGANTLVTYTYTVTNNGNVPLTVNLSDDELGDVDGGSGFSLAVGASQTFTKSANISETTTNTVTATGVASGGASATATASATVTAYNCSITVTKTASEDDICAGTTVDYSYTVTNNSTQFSWTGSLVDDNGTPNDTSDDITIDGSITLGPSGGGSDSASFSLNDVTLSADTTNTATASGDFDDASTTTASDTDDAFVDTHLCTITLTKTAGEDDICAGTTVDYSYTVTNNSPQFTWTGSLVDDNGTPGNTNDDVTVSSNIVLGPSGGASSSANFSLNDVTLSTDTTNTATASGSFDDASTTSASDTDDATVDTHVCTITVTKTASVEEICTGGSVDYSYSVTNNSTEFTWTGSLVDDKGTPNDTSDDVTVDGSITLGPGITDNTFTLNDVVLEATTTNTATASGTFDDGTATSASDTDDATVTVNDCTITVTKTPSSDDICVGGTVSYNYTVTNNSPQFTWEGSLIDDNGTPNDATDDVTVDGSITLGPLGGGSNSANFSLANVVLNADTTNIATASGNFDDAASTPANDTDSATVDTHLCTITVTKTPNVEDICVGKTVSYAYTVTNNSPEFTWTGNLVDDKGTPGNAADDVTISSNIVLGPDGGGSSSANFSLSNVTLTSDTTNTATASGSFNDVSTTSASDNDTAFVDTHLCTISVTKTPSDTEVCNGDTVIYTYVVTNNSPQFTWTGDLVDDNGTPNDTGDDVTVGNDFTLDPTGGTNNSRTFTDTAAITGQVTNIAVASGSFGDPAATSASAQDDATVTGVDCGRSQLTPTGNECPAFVAGTAQTLVFTANRSRNIAPGQFFYYTELDISGQTIIQHKVSSNPANAADPTINTMKVFTADCVNISDNFSLDSSGNIATYTGNLGAGPTTIIIRTGYNTPKGVAGTIFTFETFVNNLLQGGLTQSITVN